MKKSLYLSLISGLLFSISWPIYGFPLFIFFAFFPLLVLEKKIFTSNYTKKHLKLFLFSLISFFIWNLSSCWWIYNSSVGAVSMTVILNSLVMSLVFLSYSFINKNINNRIGLLYFIVSWLSFEKLHHTWNLNWPWLSLGNTFSNYTEVIQWYEFTGVGGGSLWVLLVNTLCFYFYNKWKKENNKLIIPKWYRSVYIIILFPCVISLFMYKFYKINKTNQVTSVVVQPNINPYTDRFYGDLKNLEKGLGVINNLQVDSVDFIIFPENIFPQNKNIRKFKQNKLYKKLDTLSKKYPYTNIISGNIFYKINKRRLSSQSTKLKNKLYKDNYNTALQINSIDGISIYKKSKLVLGGEYIPFSKIILPFINNFILKGMNFELLAFTVQKKPSILKNSLNDAKIAPIICFESVFGNYVRKFVQKGANHISIITNDVWWGNTQGHKQHLYLAKLRAIENRRSISRSANTGISCFIDEKGDISKPLNYGKKGYSKSLVSLNKKITFYTKYGDYIYLLSVMFFTFIIFYKIFLLIKTKKNTKTILL